jgi:hypothetical protein
MFSKRNHPVRCKIIILKTLLQNKIQASNIRHSPRDRLQCKQQNITVSSIMYHHKYNTKKKYDERKLKSYEVIRVHTAVANAKRIHKLKQHSVNQNDILKNYQQMNQIKYNLKRGSKYIIKYLLDKKKIRRQETRTVK